MLKLGRLGPPIWMNFWKTHPNWWTQSSLIQQSSHNVLVSFVFFQLVYLMVVLSQLSQHFKNVHCKNVHCKFLLVIAIQSYCYSEACFALLLLHRDCQGPFYGLAVKEKACLAFVDFFLLYKIRSPSYVLLKWTQSLFDPFTLNEELCNMVHLNYYKFHLKTSYTRCFLKSWNSFLELSFLAQLRFCHFLATSDKAWKPVHPD